MRRRSLALLVPLLTVAAFACSTDAGVEAPPIGGTETACFDRGCVTYPSDWQAEIGEDFVSLSHPDDPTAVLGTLGPVDMQGLVEAAGGTWPASPSAVIDALFRLLGEDQDADIDGAPLLLDDGTARAEGTLEGSRFWYRLVPLEGTTALGIEVRAPNRTWQEHADLILASVAAP